MCTYVATALAGAALASSVLLTADATSVFEGASLPQVLLILVAGLVASFGTMPLLPFARKARLPLILLAALVAWLVLSTSTATWLANGRAAWNGFWHVIGLLVLGCLFRQIGRSPQLARVTAQLLVVGAVMFAAHALHQYTISLPQARARYEANPDRELRQLGLDAPEGSALRMQFESRLRSPEPLASFALTNSLAVVLSAALLFEGIVIADQLRRRPIPYASLIVGIIIWFMLSAACLLTRSRTAILAIAVMCVLTCWVVWRVRNAANDRPMTPRARRMWFSVIAVGSVGAFTALVALLSRDMSIFSGAPQSVAFRLEYWRATSKMILDYPLTGVGLGNFQSYYPRYKLLTASETIADPHNWLFDIAACCSLPALALVFIALTVNLGRNFAALRRPEQPTSVDLHSEVTLLQGSSPLDNDSHSQRVAQALWIGAAMGWLLTGLLLWILQEGIDLEAAALQLFVSFIALAFIRRGPQPSERVLRGAGLAAAVTMLLCLLATGSWQASGIAFPLVAWLAVSSFHRKPSYASELPAVALRHVDDQSPAWQSGVMLILLVGFVFQTWRPVNSSWTHAQQAMEALEREDLTLAQQSAEESRAADPIDPNVYRMVVQMLVYEAENSSPQELEALCEHVDREMAALLKCDPVPSLQWNFAAESTIALAAAAQREGTQSRTDSAPNRSVGGERDQPSPVLAPLARRLLQRATEYQEAAVERYPSNVADHAQLGVLLALLGQPDQARAEIDIAFAISDATPHFDRRMKKQQVWLPEALALFPPSTIQRPFKGSSWVQAEPICGFLRTKQ